MKIQIIFCPAYFNRLIKIISLRCTLESSCLCLFTLNPHENQVNSYSYGIEVFRLQCPQRFPYFCIISTSVNSFY